MLRSGRDRVWMYGLRDQHCAMMYRSAHRLRHRVLQAQNQPNNMLLCKHQLDSIIQTVGLSGPARENWHAQLPRLDGAHGCSRQTKNRVRSPWLLWLRSLCINRGCATGRHARTIISYHTPCKEISVIVSDVKLFGWRRSQRRRRELTSVPKTAQLLDPTPRNACSLRQVSWRLGFD
jgi:hypothetical protein